MLASPLKRSEFLASDCPCLESITKATGWPAWTAWFTLAAQEDFHADGLEVLRRHMDATVNTRPQPERYAETNLGWSISGRCVDAP